MEIGELRKLKGRARQRAERGKTMRKNGHGDEGNTRGGEAKGGHEDLPAEEELEGKKRGERDEGTKRK